MLQRGWNEQGLYYVNDITPMGGETFIDTFFKEQKEFIGFLQQQGQVSYSQNVEMSLSKTLLLSCSSYFERRITDAISDYAKKVSNADEALISLVRNKAIERQYHTYFQWSGDTPSVRPFFAMFGSTIRDSSKQALRDSDLSDASKAFLELGNLRNLLVHENFLNYPLEKTADEIYQLYCAALRFIIYIENTLNPIP